MTPAAVTGLKAGDTVTEKGMARLFGEGRDPVTGAPLGRAFPVYAPLADRVARRVTALPGDLPEADRAVAVTAIEAEEAARRSRQPVAGFDLTFSARKSVSVLWALGDDATRQAVYDAHQRALADVLAYAEATAVFTRVGAGGVAQVPTRGVIAAGFDHWDSRTGDPQLHTHVVIANKVQGPDGAWRSLDSKALHHAAVTLSELYDNRLADHLSAALPVRWGWRSRGERRNPGFEIDGLDDTLLAAFSTRTTSIDTAYRDLAARFTARHGRRPTGVEVTRLRQRATLATRPVKTGSPATGPAGGVGGAGAGGDRPAAAGSHRRRAAGPTGAGVAARPDRPGRGRPARRAGAGPGRRTRLGVHHLADPRGGRTRHPRAADAHPR